MATYRKRKGKRGTSWQVDVRADGNRVTRTFTNKADAQEWAKERERILERTGSGLRDTSKTLADLIDRYMAECPPGKDATKPGRLAWWRDELGTMKLTDVTQRLISEKLSELAGSKAKRGIRGGKARTTRKRRSGATVNRYRSVLNATFNYALQEEWWGLSANPCANTRKRPEDEPREQTLTNEQRAALFAACQAHPEPWIYPLVLLGFSTGVRAGALLMLTWPDLDLDGGTVRIRQQTAKNKKPSVKRLLPKVVATLREFGKVRSLTDDRVFPPRRLGAEKLNYAPVWKAVREAAGIPTNGDDKFVFHSLRHDHASVQVQADIPLLQVSKQLDHSNTQITERYAHLAPGDAEFEEFARAMEDKL